jgi:hypothetical protein
MRSRRDSGAIGYRCPAEPVATYVRKGGSIEDTAGRRCLCNGLTATVGLAQRRRGGLDGLPLVTLGQDEPRPTGRHISVTAGGAKAVKKTG